MHGRGMGRELSLAAYLQAEAGRRFQRGSADCITFGADWLQLRLGFDPMAAWRGYATDTEATELMAGWGGIVRVVGRGMRQAGLPLTRDPQPGDVGVIAIGNVAVGAIRTTRGWVTRLDDGLASLPPNRVRVLAAWSV